MGSNEESPAIKIPFKSRRDRDLNDATQRTTKDAEGVASTGFAGSRGRIGGFLSSRRRGRGSVSSGAATRFPIGKIQGVTSLESVLKSSTVEKNEWWEGGEEMASLRYRESPRKKRLNKSVARVTYGSQDSCVSPLHHSTTHHNGNS